MCTVTRYHISPGVLRYTKYTQRLDLRVRAVLGRVRDRACACTDALHNIFAIVKCKVPAREGVPLSQLFLASRSHAPLRNPVYVYVYMCAWLCESERRKATGAAKARPRGWGETPRKQVFVFSCKSRRSWGDWRLKHIFLYSLPETTFLRAAFFLFF